jgi:transposase
MVDERLTAGRAGRRWRRRSAARTSRPSGCRFRSGSLIADKAYDADALIDGLAEREITPVIPPKANRKNKRDCDFALY